MPKMSRRDKAEIRRLHDMLDEATDADGEIAGHRGGPDDFAPPVRTWR